MNVFSARRHVVSGHWHSTERGEGSETLFKLREHEGEEVKQSVHLLK
jgi:hypothetical protein